MKKKIFIVILLLFLFGGTAFGSYIYFQTQEWDEKIYSGISVMDVDLSGLTSDEARTKLIDAFENRILEKELTIKLEDKEYVLTYEELEARFNIDKTVENAIAFGKDLSVLEKYKIKDKNNEINFKMEFDYNSNVIDEVVSEMKSRYDQEPINSEIRMVKSGQFYVSPEQIGKELDDVRLREQVISNINADFEQASITIDAPVIITNPEIREATLKSIDTKVAEATTAFKTSGEGRSANVILATDTLNKTLLMPGEYFSFNEVVGERSVERGYKTSKVIINNELVDGTGGGVCQVSTTLYHAVMKMGLGFVERMNHTLPSSYSELGQDATVAWDYLDYKFVNTLDYPIFIEGYTKDKEIFINMYSNSSVIDGEYVMVSNVVEVLEPTVKKIEDPELYVGEEVVVKKPITGYIVEVYREHRKNGRVLKKEFISKDRYQVVNGETKIGTKPKEENSETAKSGI
ncbi:VanW family protein [Oceanirhabdus sp. W0125-5]|uniref:VanW family protein n=1 Tax=Oceanirhabdus sp. W0125-5 TaxID=2999116 RepID=UPI0022F2BBA9|nr:VanW family protein [Oceanirhabdus sp. W0125-5]WBW98793.1 VanW family protein [Oceanirhabdus sp. W0125-5]